MEEKGSRRLKFREEWNKETGTYYDLNKMLQKFRGIRIQDQFVIRFNVRDLKVQAITAEEVMKISISEDGDTLIMKYTLHKFERYWTSVAKENKYKNPDKVMEMVDKVISKKLNKTFINN